MVIGYMRKMKGSNIQVVLRDIDSVRNIQGRDWKYAKREARERHRRAIHFSLTRGGGGAQSIFSYKPHHSLHFRFSLIWLKKFRIHLEDRDGSLRRHQPGLTLTDVLCSFSWCNSELGAPVADAQNKCHMSLLQGKFWFQFNSGGCWKLNGAW